MSEIKITYYYKKVYDFLVSIMTEIKMTLYYKKVFDL